MCVTVEHKGRFRFNAFGRALFAQLKTLNPNVANITYDIADLYMYIDQLADISCLVFHDPINAYLPRDRDWLKKRIYSHLRESAGESVQ